MDFEKKNKTKQINKLKTLRNSRTVCRYVQLHNVSVMTINQLWLVEFKSDLIEFFHHFMPFNNKKCAARYSQFLYGIKNFWRNDRFSLLFICSRLQRNLIATRFFFRHIISWKSAIRLSGLLLKGTRKREFFSERDGLPLKSALNVAARTLETQEQ